MLPRRITLPVMVLSLMVAACAPPEAQRVQGGDRGGDIGNRSAVVEMHAGSVIYPDERCAVRGVACTGPLPVSGLVPVDSPTVVSPFVLDPMGRGGRVRPVIYRPPSDLALPDPAEIELPFPGPGIDGGGEAPPDPVPPGVDSPRRPPGE
jgi:hypothetical protein